MPEGKAAFKQKEWDRLLVQEEYSQLLASFTEPRHRPRLLAASSDHSGDWLHVLPIAACGLHLDNEAMRVAVGLRLGCVLRESHTCRCGATSMKEPHGLVRDDGKRPDGLTLLPWNSGRSAT